LAGVDAQQEQSWQKYTLALLAFNLAGFLLLFAILLFQDYLPLNPQQLPGRNGRRRSTPPSVS
jgi:potassium-transporting ATPase potassium-binding subunit